MDEDQATATTTLVRHPLSLYMSAMADVSLSLAGLRADQKRLAQQRSAIQAKYEAELRSVDEDLADTEAAIRLCLKQSRPSQIEPVPEGQNRNAKPVNRLHRPETDKERVLAAIRSLCDGDRHRVLRHVIIDFVEATYGKAIPPQSVSTYLRRLREDELIETDGVSWWPAGGAP